MPSNLDIQHSCFYGRLPGDYKGPQLLLALPEDPEVLEEFPGEVRRINGKAARAKAA
jgi:hypothetical protein